MSEAGDKTLEAFLAQISEKPAAAPDLRVLGRTGSARHVAAIRGAGKSLAHRTDRVSFHDYARARRNPFCKDALDIKRKPIERCPFHFTCEDEKIAAFAAKVLTRPIREAVRELAKGAYEFGTAVLEKRWELLENVEVVLGQSDTGTGDTGGKKVSKAAAEDKASKDLLYTIHDFGNFDMRDTTLLVDAPTGYFGGIRQHVGANAEDLEAEKCVHFVFDTDFDELYGIPATVAALPYVEQIEGIFDDMALYSSVFGAPWKRGRYPEGMTQIGTDPNTNAPMLVSNKSMMFDLVDTLGSGHAVATPSNRDVHGELKWDVDIIEMPRPDQFVEKLQYLENVIRKGMGVPELASSKGEGGSYGLGIAQIDNFVMNVEADISRMDTTLNEQLMDEWTTVNFGRSAPRCTVTFQSPVAQIWEQLVQALIDALKSGTPISDANGNEIVADWAKIAKDAGIPVSVVDIQEILERTRQRVEAENPPDDGPPKEAGLSEGYPGDDQVTPTQTVKRQKIVRDERGFLDEVITTEEQI